MAAGCTAGLVNAGGDLRVFGQRTEPMFVRGPQGQLTNIEITNAALAVSDASSEQSPPEHQGYYVRTGASGHQHAGGLMRHVHCDQRATTDAQTVVNYSTTYAAVIASTSAVADALVKCVLLCPAPTAARALAAFGATQPLVAAT